MMSSNRNQASPKNQKGVQKVNQKVNQKGSGTKLQKGSGQRVKAVPNLKSCQVPLGKTKLALPKSARKKPTNVGYYAEKGPREYMEDTYQVMHFNAKGKKGTFYGVFDGHGGKDVSYQLINTRGGLFPYLIQKLKNKKPSEAIPKLLKEAYVEYDRILFNKKLKSGSTAAVVLRYDDKLYLINLGDSRSLVFFDGDRTMKVTADHKPWLSTERNRIYRAGYYVNPFKIYQSKSKKRYDNGDIYVGGGGYSMYLSGKWEPITADQYKQIQSLNSDVDTHRVCNSLALSRAFGDFYLKINKEGKYMGKNAAVSPEPDVMTINLKPKKGKRGYILIASDGFWDVARVTANFKQVLKTHPNVQELSKILVKDALTKGSQDNTSVVLDRFQV